MTEEKEEFALQIMKESWVSAIALNEWIAKQYQEGLSRELIKDFAITFFQQKMNFISEANKNKQKGFSNFKKTGAYE